MASKKYKISIPSGQGYDTSYLFYRDYLVGLKNGDKIVSKAKTLTIKLDYPFGNPPVFVYKRKSKAWTLRDVLKRFIMAYNRAYRNEDKYQVWGHYLTDLTIDSITISSGKVTCAVSS